MLLVSISNIVNNITLGALNRKKFNPGSWVLTKSLEGLTEKFWDEPIAGTPQQCRWGHQTSYQPEVHTEAMCSRPAPIAVNQGQGGQSLEVPTAALLLQLLLSTQEPGESKLQCCCRTASPEMKVRRPPPHVCLPNPNAGMYNQQDLILIQNPCCKGLCHASVLESQHLQLEAEWNGG